MNNLFRRKHSGSIFRSRFLTRPFGVVFFIALFLSPYLLAESENSGTVVLRWTAPGDDEYVGRATGYQIRYQAEALGPIDTEDEWQSATQLTLVPTPSAPYTTDSVAVFDLVPGQGYYFALKAYDDVHNYSELSNSPLVFAEEIYCCEGRVGNANNQDTDEPTIGDISTLVDHLFITQSPLWCPAEADVNQSGGLEPRQGPNGDITLGDISTLIDYLFLTGQPLKDCLGQ